MTKYTYFDVEIFLFVTTTIKNEETTFLSWWNAQVEISQTY